jgi:hypothetical protein
MASQFTLNVLASVELPQPLIKDLLTKPHLAPALAENTHLGSAAGTLVRSRKLPAKSLVSLVASGNTFALDAILDTSEKRQGPLSAIHHYWQLSAPDQVRFANMDLPTVVCVRMIRSMHVAPAARALLVDKLRARYRTVPTPPYPLEPAPVQVSKLRTPLVVRTRYTPSECEHFLGRTIKFLAIKSLILRGMSPAFSEELGDASTPGSLRAWMVFLDLADEAEDVPLKSVFATAKRLAHAELVSN